ncbi:hypothetical protein GCM10009544_67000 [Streptomyces stramineus]|uniref:Uncharacterized protein n=1 Tax=Streptomyces stramineus TaxID=173861 RepID=A0ABP3LI01_9ACTN
MPDRPRGRDAAAVKAVARQPTPADPRGSRSRQARPADWRGDGFQALLPIRHRRTATSWRITVAAGIDAERLRLGGDAAEKAGRHVAAWGGAGPQPGPAATARPHNGVARRCRTGPRGRGDTTVQVARQNTPA